MRRPSTVPAKFTFWLLVSLIAVAAGGKAILYDTLDPDCFWHLRVAGQLHRQGIGPIVDELSFASAREPWTPYSWLAELGMKAVWDAGGYRAAIATQAIMQAAIVLLLAGCCVSMQRTVDLPRYLGAAVAVFGGTFLMVPYLSFRPVTAAFVLLLLIAWLVQRDAQKNYRTRAVWLIVPLTVVLTNVHLFSMLVPAGLLLLALGLMRNPFLAGARKIKTEAQRHREEASNPFFSPRLGVSAVRHSSERNLTAETPRRGDEFAAPDLCDGSEITRAKTERRKDLKQNHSLFLSGSASLRESLFSSSLGETARLMNNSVIQSRLGMLATLTTFACLTTPMLGGMLCTAGFYATKDRMVAGPVIAEMQSFARGPMGWVSAGIVLITAICVGRHYRRFTLGPILIAVAAAALMFKLGRFALVFAIAGIPLLAASLPHLSDRLFTRPLVFAALLCVLCVGVTRVATSFPDADVTASQWLNRHGPDLPGYPCDAADFVAANIENSTGRLINEFNWGGYLAWRLDGRYQTLLDGRTQVFPAELWQATYLGTEQDTARKLATVEADAAVVPIRSSRFHDTLIRLGWTSVYRDDRAEVLRPPGAVAGLTPE